jgi:hypothetical protein
MNVRILGTLKDNQNNLLGILKNNLPKTILANAFGSKKQVRKILLQHMKEHPEYNFITKQE